MSRAGRLLRLLEILRRRRGVVTASELASAMEVSIRTIYRDIEALRVQGVTIDGEAGTGYRVQAGYVLPPLMFTEDELEALLLGARWVSERTDRSLGKSARSAMERIQMVLPSDLKSTFQHTALFVAPTAPRDGIPLDLSSLREAIRERRRLRLLYSDANGTESERVVWPTALAFFDSTRILAAWCELRKDFRHFRLDRLQSWSEAGGRFPGSRAALLARWKESLGIPES
ncbi:MAG: YafY family transcriptional regulator [Fibrobacterota bacterium]|nr:YafY family transcriptional regulator [Fibrobacterota bacterium]QQS05995.1 MAG: YafY family transcriptional regulator [Fibrobacterota bacterium]